MRIVSIASARPNFVKLAAVHHAFQKHAPQAWKHVIIHTGQHYDPLLSDVFFEELGIPKPDKNLEVKGGVSNEDTVERTRQALLPVLKEMKPDLVLVYGDVSGAHGAAKAASELRIPVAHVEAGLRSFDESMPEEGNRKAIDHLAKFLFVTEKSGMKNLEDENVTEGVHFVGNTMIDTLSRMLALIEKEQLPIALPPRFGVVTLHRPSNVDEGRHLKKVMQFLSDLSLESPLIFPIHPRTRAALGSESPISAPLHLCDPLGYLAFLKLVKQASFVLTDSGGIQEEATFLKKKCFTLRKNTERPSTIESGSNTLVDLEKADDREQVLLYAKDPKPLPVSLPPLWDGRAGERIIEILKTTLI